MSAVPFEVLGLLALRPLPLLFAVVACAGGAASFLVQRRCERQLAAPERTPIADAWETAQRQAFAGVALGLAVFVLGGRSSTALVAAVAVFAANAVVLFLRRRRALEASDEDLHRLAAGAFLASLGLFLGAAGYLLTGGLGLTG